MKLSDLNEADDARSRLKQLRAIQEKTNRAARYDGFLAVAGEVSLLMTPAEVDAVLARKEAELMEIFAQLGVEVDE